MRLETECDKVLCRNRPALYTLRQISKGQSLYNIFKYFTATLWLKETMNKIKDWAISALIAVKKSGITTHKILQDYYSLQKEYSHQGNSKLLIINSLHKPTVLFSLNAFFMVMFTDDCYSQLISKEHPGGNRASELVLMLIASSLDIHAVKSSQVENLGICAKYEEWKKEKQINK